MTRIIVSVYLQPCFSLSQRFITSSGTTNSLKSGWNTSYILKLGIKFVAVREEEGGEEVNGQPSEMASPNAI